MSYKGNKIDEAMREETEEFLEKLYDEAFNECYPQGVPSEIDISTFHYGFRKGLDTFCKIFDISSGQILRTLKMVRKA